MYLVVGVAVYPANIGCGSCLGSAVQQASPLAKYPRPQARVGAMIDKESCCLLPPAVSILSQVSYDRFLVGQAFMRRFKTCLQLPDSPINIGFFRGVRGGFFVFTGNGWRVNPM